MEWWDMIGIIIYIYFRGFIWGVVYNLIKLVGHWWIVMWDPDLKKQHCY